MMIISVHIRKCAGTSFRSSLGAFYGDAALFDYGDEVGSSWPSSIAKRAKRQEEAVEKADELQAQYKLIHGHFFRKKYDFLTEPRRYVTFLRDPVQRVVSNYLYLGRNPNRRNPDALIVNRLGFSLEEFVAHPDNQNLQSHYIQSANLDLFDFVGVVESYQASIAGFNRCFDAGLRVDDRLNANADGGSGYDIEPKIRTLIENNNLEDLRLYDLARNRLAGGTTA